MRPSKALSSVRRGELCAGCGLCAAAAPEAIRMETAAPGYARPVQTADLTPAQEALIAEACPGLVVEPWTGVAPHTHPYWGPWRSVSTGHANDPKVRWGASSGGAITALLIHALESGLIDRVVHVAADPRRPTGNIVVCSREASAIAAGAGSRYAASSPLEVIERELGAGGAFAVVGKPCDISALRRLGRLDPRVARHVPLALSFFCAGVPSHEAAGRVLDAMGAPADQVTAFRYRGEGWPGDAAATLANGEVRRLSYEGSWGDYLSKELQFRCKICPDGVGGAADIACADAWYGDDKGYPSFEEQDGRSLIMARTEAGERFLSGALAAGALTAAPLDIGEIDRMQPSQARRKRVLQSRRLALAATLQPAPKVEGTLVETAAARAKPREQLREFLGAFRRVLNGRRSRR